MKYIITGDFQGQNITRTAYSDFQAFTLIGQLGQEGITDISMKAVNEAELNNILPEEKQSSQGLARMRTAHQAADYFKQLDPETSFTEYHINRLIKTGVLPVFKSGNKRLINLDKLIQYLNSEIREQEPASKDYGKIRRVGD
ncbi:hypothetical protein [Anaerocolumna xylanovorans]|uniref:DNA binding domain-containing protein, excisionase family n=1 Tax=Anaerocolumna xylanovorans DSM 12503 TaxID=1121345 RepID=A0A1M7Y3R6_9FIRM|nr:hypothetical protein [Anaerocolumna xylanovorans]SHO46814.1 hypothetical protein SAMN02745217_01297 [Anaerocolumna xylanovorans DSM 12503]